MNNHNGNSFLVFLMVLMTITGLSLSSIKIRLRDYLELRDKQKLILCTKEINGETIKLIQYIEQTNKYLKILTLANFASLIIPGLGKISKVSAKAAIKKIKSLQQFSYNAYMKNMLMLKIKKCHVSTGFYKTPYENVRWLKLKRDKFNQTIFRGNEWSYISTNSKLNIKNIFLRSGKSRSYPIQKVNLFSL